MIMKQHETVFNMYPQKLVLVYMQSKTHDTCYFCQFINTSLVENVDVFHEMHRK